MRDFPGGPEVKTLYSQSLVRELGSHMPHGVVRQKKKKKEREFEKAEIYVYV